MSCLNCFTSSLLELEVMITLPFSRVSMWMYKTIHITCNRGYILLCIFSTVFIYNHLLSVVICFLRNKTSYHHALFHMLKVLCRQSCTYCWINSLIECKVVSAPFAFLCGFKIRNHTLRLSHFSRVNCLQYRIPSGSKMGVFAKTGVLTKDYAIMGVLAKDYSENLE